MFSTEALYANFTISVRATRPAHLTFIDLIVLTMLLILTGTVQSCGNGEETVGTSLFRPLFTKCPSFTHAFLGETALLRAKVYFTVLLEPITFSGPGSLTSTLQMSVFPRTVYSSTAEMEAARSVQTSADIYRTADQFKSRSQKT